MLLWTHSNTRSWPQTFHIFRVNKCEMHYYKTLCSIGCKVIFYIDQTSRYYFYDIKNRSFFILVVPSQHPKSFFKNKKNQSPDVGMLGPDRALLTDARRGRRGQTLLPDLLGPPRGPPRASVEQWERLDRRVVGAVGPPRRREQWEPLDCLEQWEQWGLIASIAAYSLPPPSTTSVSLETGAAAAAA
jgi:hypothetical protein